MNALGGRAAAARRELSFPTAPAISASDFISPLLRESLQFSTWTAAVIPASSSTETE
jgi:hypothetical protein